MQRLLRVSGALAVLAATTACATAPIMNPRIAAAETALSRANADPQTHDLGRASLEDASTQLAAARQALKRHNDDDFTHAIRMAETDIQLAQVRGDQAKAEMAIERIASEQAQVQIDARDRDVARAEAGRANAERATTIAVAGQARAEQASRQVRQELADYEMRETSLGMTLMLQDLQFATASSVLREAAKTRLDPLAAYLMRNDATNIRIAGFTDSLGEASYNQTLSQNRAGSVAAYLVARGVNAARIQAVGLGEAAPVASNGTTSGREQNRRVEVTLLKR